MQKRSGFDNTTAELNGTYVGIAGAETVTGDKTFSGKVIVKRDGWIDVRGFPGYDPIGADNSAAVQAAMNSGPGTLLYPQGTTMAKGLVLKPNQIHKGFAPNNFFNNVGTVGSVLKLPAAANDHMFKADPSNLSPSIVFEDMELDGNKANQTLAAASNGIFLADVTTPNAHDAWVKLLRSYIHDFAQDGFYQGINRRACTLDHTYLMNMARMGAFINGSDSSLLKVAAGLNGVNGVYVNSGATRILGCDIFVNAADGLVFDAGCTNCFVGAGTVLDFSGLAGASLVGGANQILFNGVIFKNNSQLVNHGAPHLNVGPGSTAVSLVGCMFNKESFVTTRNPNYDIFTDATALVTETNSLVVAGGFFGHTNNLSRVTNGLLIPSTNALTVGESVFDRALINTNTLAMSTGVLRLAYFKATKTETITQIRALLGAVAAGATPTIARIGVWTAGLDGSLIALIASTPNDTALLSGSLNTAFTKALSANWDKVAGTYYAVGLLEVTAATAAQVVAQVNGFFPGGEAAESPRFTASLTGQTDLPAGPVAAGSLTAAGGRPYFALVP